MTLYTSEKNFLERLADRAHDAVPHAFDREAIAVRASPEIEVVIGEVLDREAPVRAGRDRLVEPPALPDLCADDRQPGAGISDAPVDPGPRVDADHPLDELASPELDLERTRSRAARRSECDVGVSGRQLFESEPPVRVRHAIEQLGAVASIADAPPPVSR